MKKHYIVKTCGKTMIITDIHKACEAIGDTHDELYIGKMVKILTGISKIINKHDNYIYFSKDQIINEITTKEELMLELL